MSNLDKAARDKLPKSAFALPDQRLYPIVDQDDVDSAAKLIGKHPNAKAGVIRLAKAKGLKLPDAWQTADMSAAPDMVIKRGKIFEAGAYPGQRLSITPEEMFAAVESFTAKPIKDTHPNSLLAGKMGQVQCIALDPENPYDLIGEVAIPKWLDEALTGTNISVSAEWNREHKTFEGLALLTDPQVEDAALFAAFAKAQHNTPQGQQTMQMVHDDVARAGAICKPPADFSSKHEATATQQIHDITVEHGATCASGSKPAWYSKQQPTPESDNATGTAVHFSAANNRRARMSFGERFKTWFTGGMVGDLPLADEPVTAPPATFGANPASDPTIAALQAKLDSQDKTIEGLTAARIQAEAVAFADGEIGAHRSYPNGREAMIAAFSQASIDDAKGPATFSAGKSRVQLLREEHALRPAHALTTQTENLTPEELAEFMKSPLVNQMTTAQSGAPRAMTPERKQALLGSSPLGRDVVAQRNGQSHN